MADEQAWDWPRTGFPAPTDIVTHLAALYPPPITRQVLQRFFYRRRQSAGAIYPRVGKICRLVGEHLLSVTKKFALSDFLSVWCAAVPRGMRPKLKRHLTCSGRAYCEHSSIQQQKSITLLPSEDLPDESVDARLEALFDRMPVWPESELAGYVADLVVTISLDKPTCLPLNASAEEELAILSECEDDNEDETLAIDEEEDPTAAALDAPKPVPAALGTLLNHSCRVSQSTENGRAYTEKYPRC